MESFLCICFLETDATHHHTPPQHTTITLSQHQRPIYQHHRPPYITEHHTTPPHLHTTRKYRKYAGNCWKCRRWDTKWRERKVTCCCCFPGTRFERDNNIFLFREQFNSDLPVFLANAAFPSCLSMEVRGG